MSVFLKLLGPQSVSLRIGEGQRVTIGRSPKADLSLEDSLVSRQHCEVEAIGGGALRIRDLASRNGTELNGSPVRGAAVARDGDQIRVGRASLLVDVARARPGKLSGAGTARLKGSKGPLADGGFLPALPGYEVVELLAEGRSSFLYRAIREANDDEVAIKLLKPGAEESTATRFLRGAETLALLDHPNLVRIIDANDAAPYRYYVMPLLRGATLEDALRERPLGPRETLSLGIQVARALRLVHGHGLVHRDLNPTNVMLMQGGITKLVGFSFVKDLGSDDGRLTKLGDAIGETAFIPPEQARDPRSVDPRSDVYSLGAVLFFAASGRPPFEGKGLACFRKVLSEPAPSLHEIVPDAPKLLDAIVAECLDKDPENRFSSSEALETALHHALLETCRPAPVAATVAGDDGGSITSTHARLPAIAPASALGGGFHGLELVEIVQFLELHRKTGRLDVSSSGATGAVFLREGLIVSATAETEIGATRDEPAARCLVGATEGTFAFEALDRVDPNGISIRPSSLALEVMRTRDEAESIR